MSFDDYAAAKKRGNKQFKAAQGNGKSGYPVVLDELLEGRSIAGELSLGIREIPLNLVIGTKTAGRSNAFSVDFMPLVEEKSEFASKWVKLLDAQMEEGIREPIVAYEYQNRYYVQEGNKRVSVLKFLENTTILARVTRVLPVRDESQESLAYYESLRFQEKTGILDILFPEVGNYETLLRSMGKNWESDWDEREILRLKRVYYHFRGMYENMSSDITPEHVGAAFLRCLEIIPYEELKETTSSQMKEKLQVMKAEIKPEALDSDVERVMEPEQVETPIINKLLSNQKRFMKVAFVYEGEIEGNEWNYAHELGRKQLESCYEGQIVTGIYQKGTEEDPDNKVIEQAIVDGNKVIFTTSAKLMRASVQVALEHPEVQIFNCSINFPYKSVRTYLTRTYETKFLLGLIAGSLADRKEVIGYEARFPMYGTMANINAFAIGVAMVRPEAKVRLIWTGVKDADVEEQKKDLNIISAGTMIRQKDPLAPYGLYCKENARIRRLATGVVNWGRFYERMVGFILEGAIKNVSGNKRTLNYWWGLSAGVEELVCSNNVPDSTIRLARNFEKFISDGNFHPFEGEIRDQAGEVHGKTGEILDVEELVTMNWLAENVIGNIPARDELEEGASELLDLQGL